MGSEDSNRIGSEVVQVGWGSQDHWMGSVVVTETAETTYRKTERDRETLRGVVI